MPLLSLAQYHVVRRTPQFAGPLLERAAKLDPTDARLPMTAAWMAGVRGEHAAAEAKYLVALVLEEAQANFAGFSLQPDARWISRTASGRGGAYEPPAKIYSRTAGIRLCLATTLIESGQLERAREVLRQNIAMLERLDNPDVEQFFAFAPGRRPWAAFTKELLPTITVDTASTLAERSRAALELTDAAAAANNPRAGRLAGSIFRRMMLEIQPVGRATEVRAMGLLCISWMERQLGRRASAERYNEWARGSLDEEVWEELPLGEGKPSHYDLQGRRDVVKTLLDGMQLTDQQRQQLERELEWIEKQLQSPFPDR